MKSRTLGLDPAYQLPAYRARQGYNSGSEQGQAAGLRYARYGAGGINGAVGVNNVAKTAIESKREATIKKRAGQQRRVGSRPIEIRERAKEFVQVVISAKREVDI